MSVSIIPSLLQAAPAQLTILRDERESRAYLVSRRVRVVPISGCLLPLFERRDVHDGQLGALFQRFAPVAHPCDTECTGGIVDGYERIPLPHDEWARRVYAKSHLLARGVESVTVAERDNAQRVARSWGWREKVPVRYVWIEISEFILWCKLGCFFGRGGPL